MTTEETINEESSLSVEQLEKIRARHPDLAEALAQDDPSLIKSD
ncbi:MAG: hypothetical protein QXJ74_01425 [Nitrososphaera sp.]